MNGKKKLSILFNEKPYQWGLRGDPYLWDEMNQIIGTLDCPDTEEQLVRLLENTFKQLVGVSLSSRKNIYVERYTHGGMSSGHVSPEFWRKNALPLLRSRYLKI